MHLSLHEGHGDSFTHPEDIPPFHSIPRSGEEVVGTTFEATKYYSKKTSTAFGSNLTYCLSKEEEQEEEITFQLYCYIYSSHL